MARNVESPPITGSLGRTIELGNDFMIWNCTGNESDESSFKCLPSESRKYS